MAYFFAALIKYKIWTKNDKYIVFFTFCHAFREIDCKILWNMKNNKCMAGATRFVAPVPSSHLESLTIGSQLRPYKPGPVILGQVGQCGRLRVYRIWTWRKTSRKFMIKISWKKFVYIPKFPENFYEISGKLWNIRFWGTFSYILETVWGNRNREFWENLQILENSEKKKKREENYKSVGFE